jgi:MFS family permease
VIGDYRWLLVVVAVHGLFWSALLSASGAYMTAALPISRRAEGLGYWGLASVLAIGTAPALGFWVFQFGWTTLCLEIAGLNVAMAAIAWRLPDDETEHGIGAGAAAEPRLAVHRSVEWRVLTLAVSLALISFAYGGLTSFSALYADELQVTPRSVYLSAMAVSILATRLLLGRSIDRIGYRRVLLPCLVAPPVGLTILALAQGRTSFVAAAVVFGLGFGLMFPAFTAYVMAKMPAARRGAAYGAILAAFDTGLGPGSMALGWFVHHGGFRLAVGVTAGSRRRPARVLAGRLGDGPVVKNRPVPLRLTPCLYAHCS